MADILDAKLGITAARQAQTNANLSWARNNTWNFNLNPTPTKVAGTWNVDASGNVSNIPVASLNPAFKTGTNQSSNSASWMNTAQAISLASGALGMYGTYLGDRGQVRALKAQAREYDTQRLLNYDAYRTQVQYMGEENLYNVEQIKQQYDEFAGEQLAQMGASGFDISSGDQRVLADTEIKKDNAIYLANRSAYLQSFELWRSTMLENNRLQAAAKMARSQAKYMKKMSKINLLSGALSTAANFISLGSYGKTGNIGVDGVKNG